mmetsp:Transcript_12182/g.15207  ORF Transcript_12182/g.15207 Transcript_12182/m.15207 type:complete len:187 (-) Transcript_12182:19-579(-)
MAFQNSALLLIDLQKTWSRASEVTSLFPDLNENVKKLVNLARLNGMTVVHIFADYNSDNTMWYDNTSPRDIPICLKNNMPDYDIVKPIDGEKVIYKPTFDAFYQTTLDEYLKSKGIKNLYYAGLVTSICVFTSMHGGYKRGYKIFAVQDCCADTTKEYHDTTIKRYSEYDVFKVVNIKNNLLQSKL